MPDFRRVVIAVIREIDRSLGGITPANAPEAARMTQARINQLRQGLVATPDRASPSEPPNVPHGTRPADWWTV